MMRGKTYTQSSSKPREAKNNSRDIPCTPRFGSPDFEWINWNRWRAGYHCSGPGVPVRFLPAPSARNDLCAQDPAHRTPRCLGLLQTGIVNLEGALVIYAGVFLGGFTGTKLAVGISNVTLERTFGDAGLAIALKMLWAKG